MIEAFILIKVAGGMGETLEWAKTTKKNVHEIPGVLEVYGVFGRCDFIAKVRVNDMEELTKLVADRLRSIPGVQDSETYIISF
jgi:DNA-binding Lrp family transcriptional regulator